MLFNIFDFDASNVHHLTGYAPAVQLLSAITWAAWGNGYCTLRGSKIELIAGISKRQRIKATALLVEHGIISVEERSSSFLGRMSNKICRLPIKQSHLDEYLKSRRSLGLSFKLSFTSNSGRYTDGVRSEYVDGLCVEKKTMFRKRNRGAENPVKTETPRYQTGSTPLSPNRDDNKKYTAMIGEETAKTGKENYHSGGSASPPPAGDGDLIIPEDSTRRSRGRDSLIYLMSVISALTDHAKALPRSKRTEKKLRGVIKRMGLIDAEAYLRYVITKGEAWMANFDWGLPDIYALMCKGAVRQWRLDTGRLQPATITKQRASHRAMLSVDEYDPVAMSDEKEVGW